MVMSLALTLHAQTTPGVDSGSSHPESSGQRQATVPDPLTRARRAYNDKQYDAAVLAAQEAAKQPALANSAAVVLGRALAERFRSTGNAADLDAARNAFAQVKPDQLSPSDRTEFLVGHGVVLYLDVCADTCLAAAAEFFDLALIAGGSPDQTSREAIFEWWASTLDRQAQTAPDDSRLIYKRILDRAEAERARDIDSTSATFWIAAAARGVGDFERSWGAAVAGWVRAKYLGPRGEALRTELNRFVYDVLLPERAKQLIPDADPRPQLEVLRKQWADVIDKYK